MSEAAYADHAEVDEEGTPEVEGPSRPAGVVWMLAQHQAQHARDMERIAGAMEQIGSALGKLDSKAEDLSRTARLAIILTPFLPLLWALVTSGAPFALRATGLGFGFDLSTPGILP